MKLDLLGHRNLGDAFAERAADSPDRTALTIYGAADSKALTFGELACRARLLAAGLTARLACGDRVLIALPTCTEFAELYLACLFAGLIAVPAPPPGSSATAADRVAAIARDCSPALVFTADSDRLATSSRLSREGLGCVRVEVPGEIDQAGASAAASCSPTQDTLAVLQYSSGSTGSPKGVTLAHGDILANMAAYGARLRIGPGESLGGWMPLHHDFGLFGQFSAAVLFGAPVVLMPPTAFVRRPGDWLRMMDGFGVTITGAPNFAYDLCLRVIADDLLDGLDLSRLRVIINAAEPIHAPTMTAFTRRFARAGLRPESVTPGYGLAEATVYVSLKDEGRLPTILVADPVRLESLHQSELHAAPGEGKPVVGVGSSSYQMRIVDPQTRRVLPDGAIGEVWLRGRGIGRGYWNRPELSERVFAARLANSDGAEPGWLRTGDLGSIVDSELFITGRIKEILIVRGRNLYPHDLEQEARAAHHALGGCVGAAFGVAVPDERIVLVHEVRPKVPPEELPAVAAAVARRLTVAVGAPVRNVLLVRRGTVRRTTSGKIQRVATRARFLAGDIRPLYADLEPGVLAAIGVPDA